MFKERGQSLSVAENRPGGYPNLQGQPANRAAAAESGIVIPQHTTNIRKPQGKSKTYLVGRIRTCKKNDVNPYQWLRKVLEVIPTYKVNRLTDLLPQNLAL